MIKQCVELCVPVCWDKGSNDISFSLTQLPAWKEESDDSSAQKQIERERSNHDTECEF